MTQALFRESRIGCPWKHLYADDLTIMSDNLEYLDIQVQVYRTYPDTRDLRINVGKTKILGSSGEAQKPTANVKWFCSVCSKGVCVNSMLCQTATSGFIKDAWELKEH